MTDLIERIDELRAKGKYYGDDSLAQIDFEETLASKWDEIKAVLIAAKALTENHESHRARDLAILRQELVDLEEK